MKGDPKVIAFLNDVLKAELTAINQYFLHSEMCENWGYERMAKIMTIQETAKAHGHKASDYFYYLQTHSAEQSLRRLYSGP